MQCARLVLINESLEEEQQCEVANLLILHRLHHDRASKLMMLIGLHFSLLSVFSPSFPLLGSSSRRYVRLGIGEAEEEENRRRYFTPRRSEQV